ncbi:MAG: V-type ATP synthase subunit D [Firmicutes bacterium]|nr:V-type ATP synthase subunit D [Bacillota bacterium]
MAERLNVNPTRMELQRQKARLRTAARGWKLLKDKSDEMIRTFMELAKENKRLRESLDGEVVSALQLFLTASTQMSKKELESAISATAASRILSLEAGTTSIMGLPVPKLEVTRDGGGDITLIKTTSSFDKSINTIARLLRELMHLAEIEKSCDMLASEIIRLRRRINALEFILMPQIRATIRFINMKLAENERSQLVRVMKVKEQQVKKVS